MKRKAKIIRSKGSRHIAVDMENEQEIFAYINQSPNHTKKFRHILDVILEGHKVPDIFDKEDINEQCKDVWAMKFFKGGTNDRIYCKEVRTADSMYVIVTSELLLKKKNNKNQQREKNLILKVAGYEYTIIK